MELTTFVELDPSSCLREVLPTLLLSSPRPQMPQAVIQFVVTDRPDCDVAYYCSPPTLEIIDGLVDDVDVTLTLSSEDLLAFTRRALDVPQAIRSRRLKVLGRARVLDWLTARIADAAHRGVS